MKEYGIMDEFLSDLKISGILKMLNKNDVILDVGCGVGIPPLMEMSAGRIKIIFARASWCEATLVFAISGERDERHRIRIGRRVEGIFVDVCEEKKECINMKTTTQL